MTKTNKHKTILIFIHYNILGRVIMSSPNKLIRCFCSWHHNQKKHKAFFKGVQFYPLQKQHDMIWRCKTTYNTTKIPLLKWWWHLLVLQLLLGKVFQTTMNHLSSSLVWAEIVPWNRTIILSISANPYQNG